MRAGKFVLVTGAAGFVGRHVCDRFRRQNIPFVGLDRHIGSSAHSDLLTCDITNADEMAQIFREHPIGTVIHLAAVLPSAARVNPELATRVNITASGILLETAARSGVQRFVFASSMSVYGAFGSKQVFTVQDPTAPIDLYGTAKRYIELYGEVLAKRSALQVVSLRIAGVVGAGSNSQTSAWRSEIFEKLGTGSQQQVVLPFEPDSILSLVHVEDVAEMLVLLGQTQRVASPIYNTPAENWPIQELKERLESIDRSVSVEIPSHAKPAPPLADGSLFLRDFGYQLATLENRLRHASRRPSESRI